MQKFYLRYYETARNLQKTGKPICPEEQGLEQFLLAKCTLFVHLN